MMGVALDVEEGVWQLLSSRPDISGAVGAVIERAALAAAVRVGCEFEPHPVVMWVDPEIGPRRPILLAPVGKIDPTGVFMLTHNQVSVLEGMKDRDPGVLILYGEAGTEQPVVKYGKNIANVPVMYRRLAPYAELEKVKSVNAGVVFKEVYDKLEADGVFFNFFCRRTK